MEDNLSHFRRIQNCHKCIWLVTTSAPSVAYWTVRWQETFIRDEPSPPAITSLSVLIHILLCCVGLSGYCSFISHTANSKAHFSKKIWRLKAVPSLTASLLCSLSLKKVELVLLLITLHPAEIWHSSKFLQPWSFLWVTRSKCHHGSKPISRITPIGSHTILKLSYLAGRYRRNR